MSEVPPCPTCGGPRTVNTGADNATLVATAWCASCGTLEVLSVVAADDPGPREA